MTSKNSKKTTARYTVLMLTILLAACCIFLSVAIKEAKAATNDAAHFKAQEEGAKEDGQKEEAKNEESKEEEQKQTEPRHIKLRVKKATARTITLKWSKVRGATKYYVYRAKGKLSKFKRYKTLPASKRTYKDKKISTKKKYYYAIKAKTKDAPAESGYVVKPKVRGNFKRGSVFGPYLSSKQLKKLKDILANIVCRYQTEQLSQKDKIYFAHDYIAYKTSYSTSGAQVASALGPLKYGKAHCQGYSRAFVALAAAMGVKSRYIHASSAATNPAHQWNMVKLRGKWYLIDVQCNDSSGFDAVMLMGRDRLKGFFKKAYRYNKKGKPKLAKKSFPARKYYFNFK